MSEGRGRNVTEKWTLVQHSGAGYARKPGFAHAVEERSVRTKAEQNKVLRNGGVLLDDYNEASELAFELNYPEGYLGLYPDFRGTFSKEKIDGLAIAIPIRKVVASEEAT